MSGEALRARGERLPTAAAMFVGMRIFSARRRIRARARHARVARDGAPQRRRGVDRRRRRENARSRGRNACFYRSCACLRGKNGCLDDENDCLSGKSSCFSRKSSRCTCAMDCRSRLSASPPRAVVRWPWRSSPRSDRTRSGRGFLNRLGLPRASCRGSRLSHLVVCSPSRSSHLSECTRGSGARASNAGQPTLGRAKHDALPRWTTSASTPAARDPSLLIPRHARSASAPRHRRAGIDSA
jgi:hypothetical protein